MSNEFEVIADFHIGDLLLCEIRSGGYLLKLENGSEKVIGVGEELLREHLVKLFEDS